MSVSIGICNWQLSVTCMTVTKLRPVLQQTQSDRLIFLNFSNFWNFIIIKFLRSRCVVILRNAYFKQLDINIATNCMENNCYQTPIFFPVSKKQTIVSWKVVISDNHSYTFYAKPYWHETPLGNINLSIAIFFISLTGFFNLLIPSFWQPSLSTKLQNWKENFRANHMLRKFVLIQPTYNALLRFVLCFLKIEVFDYNFMSSLLV